MQCGPLVRIHFSANFLGTVGDSLGTERVIQSGMPLRTWTAPKGVGPFSLFSELSTSLWQMHELGNACIFKPLWLEFVPRWMDAVLTFDTLLEYCPFRPRSQLALAVLLLLAVHSPESFNSRGLMLTLASALQLVCWQVPSLACFECSRHAHQLISVPGAHVAPH